MQVRLTKTSAAELEFMLETSECGSGELNGTSIVTTRNVADVIMHGSAPRVQYVVGSAEALCTLCDVIRADYDRNYGLGVPPQVKTAMLALANRIATETVRPTLMGRF